MPIKSVEDAVAVIERLRSYQIIALISAIILLFYWPVFSAHFSVADDHQIIQFLTNGRIAFADIWVLLTTETEAGRPFETSRYRPVYSFIRLIETWAWADWATPWFLARLAILAYFAFEAFRLVQRLMGPGYAIIFFLTILFSRVFVDSLLRLGAAESYAALGCALCITGARRISQLGLQPGNAIIVAVGTLIAVGSKENFVFLLLPLAMVAVSSIDGNKAISTVTRAVTIIALALGLVIWSAILPGTFGRGVTFYMETLPKLALLESHPVVTALAIASFAGLILITVGRMILKNRWLSSLSPKKRESLMWASLFLAAIALQLLVYRELVTRNRYGFPAIHMLIFLILMVASLVHERLQDHQWPAALKRWSLIFMSAVALFLAVAPEIKAWKRVQRMVLETQTFQARYALLADAVRRNPKTNIVFVVHRYDSYEPIRSIQRYLFRDFGRLPIALSVEGDIQRDRLATELTRRMRTWQKHGGIEFIPLEDLDLSNCIGVGFQGRKTSLPCPIVTQIWPLR